MSLAKGSTYDNIWFEYVMDGMRDILITEYPGIKIYISPMISGNENFQIRIWGTEADTSDRGADWWQKQYQTGIYMYSVEQNPNEVFWKNFYQHAERVYQLMANNTVYSTTVDSVQREWINGHVESIVMNEYEEGEEDIEGLYVARLNFECFVKRDY